MKIKDIGNVLKIFLEVCMILGTFILLFLFPLSFLLGFDFKFLVIMLYPCGMIFLFLIYQFIGLFDSLKENNPFTLKNVIRLRKGMISCFLISFTLFLSIFLSILLFYYSNMIVIYCLDFISLLFFGVGIALYILSELFKSAVEYKEENELTI